MELVEDDCETDVDVDCVILVDWLVELVLVDWETVVELETVRLVL